MKTTKKTKILALFAALTLAVIPVTSAMMAVNAAPVTDSITDNLKVVTTTGTLTVNLPDNAKDGVVSYSVKAYEILALVIPKGDEMPTTFTNNANSKNMYVVTDAFKDFFSAAKTAYTTEGSDLQSADTLYLTYDNTAHQLVLSKDTPSADKTENEDYIVIDNAAYQKTSGVVTHIGKLDKTYFEADIVSRISDSNPLASETGASAARLLSDWASKYIRDKSITEDATAVEVKEDEKLKGYKFDALPYGYYTVITTDNTSAAEQDTPTVYQSILNVPVNNIITIKSSPITIDKSVSNLIDANNANNGSATAKTDGTKIDEDTEGGTKYDKITSNVGDVNHYEVTTHIPSYTSYDLDLADTNGQLTNVYTDTIDESTVDSTAFANKYIFIFRDTMQFQDFIPLDIAADGKYGAAVNGLRITVKNSDNTTFATYKVLENGAEGYVIVPANASSVVDTDKIGKLWETDYNSTDKKNFFAINFDLKQLKAKGLDGRDIVISYNAELMGETTNDGAVNTANIRYSNDPFTPTNVLLTDDTQLYTYDLKVDKLFSDGTTDYFNDVKFKLYSDEAMSHVIGFTKTADGSYTRADSNDTAISDLAVDSDGKLALHGLGEGTYYLVEQSSDNLSNAGYNIVNPIRLVITAKDAENNINDAALKLFKKTGTDPDFTYTTASTALLDTVNMTLNRTSNEYGVQLQVLNQKGFRLPLTGELGNWFIAIGGILLVAIGGTVIVLVNRKKKDN